MQALQEKPRQTKILKIAIVGADGRKWTKEQEEKAKKKIEQLLSREIWYCEICGLNFKYPHVTGLHKEKTRLIKRENLVLVSGHCPVGKERWYNVMEEKCCSPEFEIGHIGLKSPYVFHRRDSDFVYLRVYDQGGVDTWAEIIATKLGIKTEIYPAEAMDWNDKLRCLACGTLNPLKTIKCQDGFCVGNLFDYVYGYRSRNIQIAEVCDILYDLEPKGSCKYCGGTGTTFTYGDSRPMTCRKCEGDGSYSGGTWTLRYARKLGKEVHKVIIE